MQDNSGNAAQQDLSALERIALGESSGNSTLLDRPLFGSQYAMGIRHETEKPDGTMDGRTGRALRGLAWSKDTRASRPFIPAVSNAGKISDLEPRDGRVWRVTECTTNVRRSGEIRPTGQPKVRR